MKLLLTDSGVRNRSILAALVGLLGKPVAEASAPGIPTAGYGEPGGPWQFISGRSPDPMTELGWKSVGVLELTALPGIVRERWVSWVREADALLVNGGDALYLCHWMRESGHVQAVAVCRSPLAARPRMQGRWIRRDEGTRLAARTPVSRAGVIDHASDYMAGIEGEGDVALL